MPSKGCSNNWQPNYLNSPFFILTIMSLVRLKIKGISYSQTQNGAYALILNEVEGDRKLPIVIGAFEAQSIAIALEKEIKPPRPLTHDLFKNFSDRFDIVIKQVIIHKLVDGVFYSSIICERDGIEEIIDARTSDAIALALRFNAPIFTYKTILDKAGIFLKFSSKDKESDDASGDSIIVDEILQEGETVHIESGASDGYTELTIDELEKELTKAVTAEDYEKAAKLRDEISKRN
ncbi:MAG: bifunctional DNase/RNase [Maribacter sp.]